MLLQSSHLRPSCSHPVERRPCLRRRHAAATPPMQRCRGSALSASASRRAPPLPATPPVALPMTLPRGFRSALAGSDLRRGLLFPAAARSTPPSSWLRVPNAAPRYHGSPARSDTLAAQPRRRRSRGLRRERIQDAG